MTTYIRLKLLQLYLGMEESISQLINLKSDLFFTGLCAVTAVLADDLPKLCFFYPYLSTCYLSQSPPILCLEYAVFSLNCIRYYIMCTCGVCGVCMCTHMCMHVRMLLILSSRKVLLPQLDTELKDRNMAQYTMKLLISKYNRMLR